VSGMGHDHDERDADRESEGARGPLDVEAAFADIVAHWDDPSSAPVGSWPAQEDADPVDPKALDAAEPSGEGDTPPRASVYDGPALSLAPTGWTDREELSSSAAYQEAEPEGYVPPEPPPLPRGDLVGWAAWIGVLGGPAFLLLSSLVWNDIDRIWIMLAVVAFIAGFATLVARLPGGRSEDDPDDGAVV
jgi:hypothetical protein